MENFFHETFRKVLEENYLLIPDAMYGKTKTGTGYEGKTGTGNEESHRYLLTNFKFSIGIEILNTLNYNSVIFHSF